jgi:DNA-binding transcriptional LysR family regulator
MIMMTDYSADPGGARRLMPEALSDLSLRQLLSFRAVADEGSFHAAADALDYTQSAVSQHVMALEHALGVRLFDRSRGRRTVELTEAGRLLHRHVVSITDRLLAARADLLAYAAGETGTLRVGIYQSVGARILPAIVARFSEAWPNVEVRLTEANNDEGLLELVEPGALDLSFGVLPISDGPFEAVELLRDPFVLVTAASSPLAAVRGMPSIQLIGEQRLLGFRSCRSTRWVEEQLRARGADPNFVFRSEDNGTVQAMAGAGLGAALVPLLAVDTADPSVRVLPTDLPARRVALIWHRDRYRTPASRTFVEIALDVGRELAAEIESRPAIAS